MGIVLKIQESKCVLSKNIFFQIKCAFLSILGVVCNGLGKSKCYSMVYMGFYFPLRHDLPHKVSSGVVHILLVFNFSSLFSPVCG